MKKLDFDKLEDANFTIEKEAFALKIVHCSSCKKKMKKHEIEIPLPDALSIRLNGFTCRKCNKQYLGLDEARKLDRALIISRVFQKGFSMKRKLSFDGDNYTFRIPKEFTHDVNKREIEIIPLGTNEFCVTIE